MIHHISVFAIIQQSTGRTSMEKIQNEKKKALFFFVDFEQLFSVLRSVF